MVVPTLLYTHFFFLLCFLYLFALLPPRNTPLYTDITLLHFRVAQEHGVILVQVLYRGGEGGAGVLPRSWLARARHASQSLG